jgi:penicillin amidase
MGINRAANYDEFRAAASKWDIAAQNLVYADVEGNIAYQATGEVPIRANGDGSWPVPGWTGEYEWIGLTPFDDLPVLFNPPRDYVATANNPVIAGRDFFSADFDLGYRAARIEQMIQESEAYTIASAQAMQRDNRDGGAANLVPYLLEVASDDPGVTVVQGLLGPWSEGAGAFQSTGDSAAAAAYQVTWTRLLELTFHDELPENSWPEGGSRWFEVVKRLLETADDPWWDDARTEQVEDRDTILEMAMRAANTELTDTLGNPGSWEWSRLHTATFENQTLGQSGIGPIEWVFNRDAPKRLGGAADIVNAVGYFPPDGYVVDWIPSMRMVIDLSDFSSSTAGNATGQSGHAFHSHYDDQIGDWADGQQRPLRWTREQVDADAAATLTLVPAS